MPTRQAGPDYSVAVGSECLSSERVFFSESEYMKPSQNVLFKADT
jgi:hypothetical protein